MSSTGNDVDYDDGVVIEAPTHDAFTTPLGRLVRQPKGGVPTAAGRERQEKRKRRRLQRQQMQREEAAAAALAEAAKTAEEEAAAATAAAAAAAEDTATDTVLAEAARPAENGEGSGGGGGAAVDEEVRPLEGRGVGQGAHSDEEDGGALTDDGGEDGGDDGDEEEEEGMHSDDDTDLSELSGEEEDDDDDDDDDDDEDPHAPQVRVVNGQIILDQSSLVVPSEDVNRHEPYPVVYESQTAVTSASFVNRTATERWDDDDTTLFYKGLSMVGTDFGVMAALMFPKRTRRQLKNKFKKEERARRGKVEAALANRVPIDSDLLATLSKRGDDKKDRKRKDHA